MNSKEQRSCASVCVCVCARERVCFCVCMCYTSLPLPSYPSPPTLVDISRPSGTFNQPGVKHAEGQMRRKLRSSGAEINAALLICMVLVCGAPVASLRTAVSILQFAIFVGPCL